MDTHTHPPHPPHPPARWQLTSDLDEFRTRAQDFLHSAPAEHTALLTVTDMLHTRGLHLYGDEDPLFGFRADGDGTVSGAFLWTPPHVVALSPLAPLADASAADELAEALAAAGHRPAGVGAEEATSAAFAQAWQRRTGAAATVAVRQRLYRLGTLTPPEPAPEGAARVVTAADRDLLVRWHGEFHEAVGGHSAMSAEEWADTRIAYGGVTLWETPDGTPVAMAGNTRRVAGQIRVAPVYTPADLRGRGYAGAVTAAVSRAALTAGADEVLLFTDLANPTSNGLYQRIGYRPVRDFMLYDFKG
ncbi:GNAT family N-acetyltransferase [Streptomyces sp. NPDC050658]|uniref:GNAT family N-acetyltransferase n=1 Tax=unclassified Streptomyces TaxID=2593676 RepID=UPI00341A9FAB